MRPTFAPTFAAVAALPLLAASPIAALPLPPTGIALVVAFLVVSLALHEVSHAWVALLCGDTTARDLGRISFNPLVHVDPMMTVIVPGLLLYYTGFIFGGAKPVPVAYHRLRHPLRDMMLVALAGPASNFLLAIVFQLAWKFAIYGGYYQTDQLLPRVLEYAVVLNILLAIFNLVPLPPLDGSRVMAWLLPQGLREPYIRLERWGMFLVVALVFFVPPFQAFLVSGMNSMGSVVDTITGGTWS